VVQDYKEAVKWYRLAAAQGDAVAQYNLGLSYALGQGVLQDYKEAVKWYRLAAAQGDADAQFRLGEMYEQGRGVKQNYVRAHMWFNLSGGGAVEFGDLLATFKMTSQQIAQAQKMASDCKQKNFKGCE
ncbi:MAG: tetratricopeptide repeat protein, partial [Candidatus Nitrotoga sp.]